MITIIIPPSGGCPFIVVSRVSENAVVGDFCMKHEDALQWDDYILGSAVSENAVESDLCIFRYDAWDAPDFVIASTKFENVFEEDLRVRERPHPPMDF